MGYALRWTEAHIRDVESDYSCAVAEQLQEVMEEKARQVQWVQTPADLPSRFHNVFTLEDLKVAEIAFNVHGREFRAIFVVLHDLRIAAFYAVVDKANQEKRLQQMRRDATAIETAVRQRFD